MSNGSATAGAATANGLGRTQIDGWTAAIWSDIDTAVTTDVGQVRVAQKVFPTILVPNAENIPACVFEKSKDGADIFDALPEGRSKGLIELWLPFYLTQSQVDNEAENGAGRILARTRAKSVARAEDVALFRGQHAALPDEVRSKNPSAAERGFLFQEGIEERVIRKGAEYPRSLFNDVASAISTLQKHGQLGPYALMLETSEFLETYAPIEGSLQTTADSLTSSIITGGFFPTPALSVPIDEAKKYDSKLKEQVPGQDVQHYGLLASLGGGPVSIYIGVDTTTAFSQVDSEGRLTFRVFERVQSVVTDRRALLRLRFAQEQ